MSNNTPTSSESLLKHTVVRDLLPPTKGIIVLYHTDTVTSALKRLQFHGILSAPVLHSDNNFCLGSVDVMDLVAYALDVPRRSSSWEEATKERFQSPLYKALGSSGNNPFLPVGENASVINVIRTLFGYGVHRVPVVSVNGSSTEITGILSQMDVIHFLAASILEDPELSDMASKTVSQLSLVPGQVVSIVDTCNLHSAFDLLIANKISGLAVVNTHGQLVGNISASDFKGFTESTVLQLDEQVGKFVQYQMPITCKRTDTLYELLLQFSSAMVHRVYIVDDSFVPVGIVSLTDIMKIITMSV